MGQENNQHGDEVACFKYEMIVSVLHETTARKKAWFKQMSKLEHRVPGKRLPVRFSEHTIRNWMVAYKTYGFSALYPKPRTDAGKSRVISDSIKAEIKALLEEFPVLSVAGIYRKLVKNGMSGEEFSESTLRRFIRKNKLRTQVIKSKDRKKFEFPAINQLWMVDFMHGYNIPDPTDNNRKKKTYLCAIIDDHSRMIIRAEFHYHENSSALMKTFKSAIQRYGIPKRFYCDNGASFSSQYLTKVCARLQTALIHSAPYDSPSRGKIERFFRTVRECFFAATNLNKFKSLEEFNNAFNRWLQEEYQEKVHSGIHQKPKDCYFKSLNNVTVHRKPQEQLEEDFLMSCTRKVLKNRTVKFKSQEFELPAQYVGKHVELRYPVDDIYDLRLYDSDQKFVSKLTIVDPILNSYSPSSKIRFKNTQENSND